MYFMCIYGQTNIQEVVTLYEKIYEIRAFKGEGCKFF